MKLRLHPFELQYKHTFAISRESRTVQRTLIVELNDGPHSGFGEATANKYYGTTTDGMMETLESLRPQIESAQWTEPEEFWHYLHSAPAGQSLSAGRLGRSRQRPPRPPPRTAAAQALGTQRRAIASCATTPSA
jgi:L-alanine-DL-glutamate epimerase-like enolase superfamily enzyme